MQFLQHPTLLEIKEWLNYQETAQEEEARVLRKDKKYTQEELFQQKVEFLKDYRKKFTEQQLAELVQDLKDKSSIFIAEKFEASLLRLFQILTRLFDTASKVYFSLKFDIHSKCMAYLLRTPEKITSQETASDFSSNNYSDFFQDLQRVDNVVQEQAPQQLVAFSKQPLGFPALLLFVVHLAFSGCWELTLLSVVALCVCQFQWGLNLLGVSPVRGAGVKAAEFLRGGISAQENVVAFVVTCLIACAP